MKRLPLTPLALGLLAIFAAACSAANPPTSDLSTGSSSPVATSTTPGVAIGTEDDDAGADASDDASSDAGADGDAEAGLPPPPKSICNPTLSLAQPTAVPGAAGAFRFAAISKDEKTIAFLESGTLKVADRASTSDDFGTAQTVSSDVTDDGVALSGDGLHIVAIGADRISFHAFDRDATGDAFATGDDSAYANLVFDLNGSETVGDPTFIHDESALLYSIYGRTDDTVHYATRVSEFASFDPNGPLGWPELRAENGQYRHVSGAQDDLQTLFYWDDVTGSEKLAHTNGTSNVISTTDLGAAYPYAQATGTCDRVYFGTAAMFFAATK